MGTKKKTVRNILCCVAAVLSVLVFIISGTGLVDGLKDKLLFIYDYNGSNKIIFANVMDGNCAIIKSGNSVAMFSFGGIADGGNALIKAVRKYRITKLDYAFISITDPYHLGGFMALCDNVSVNTVITPKFDDYSLNNSVTANTVKEKVQTLNYEFVELNKSYTVGEFTVTPIYYYNYAFNNSGRAVIYKISINKYSAIIGGSFSKDIMFEEFANGNLPNTDILLLPGFSDNTYWDTSYFDNIKAKYFVSSSDYKNDINLQNDFLYFCEKYNVFRTDINGDIIFYFNEEISVITEK